MWSEQRDNKWRYFERYTDPITGKQRKVSITLDRKSDKKASAMLQTLIDEKTQAASDDYTIEQAVEQYLAESRLSFRKSTVDRNEDALNSVMDIIGHDCLMSKLTAKYVRGKMLLSKKSAVTLNNYMIRFKTFIRWAYREDIINSTAIIDKFEPFHETVKAKQRIKDKFLNKDELQKLLDGMDHTANRLITEFLALSGLRIGELVALEDKDIDGDVIHVTKTYNPVSKEVTPGKTDDSIRDVRIQPELKDCIRRIRKYMKTLKMAAGVPKSPMFVISIEGDQILYFSFNKYFKAKTKQIIGRELTTHALRHTHASLLAEAGYPLEAISRRLGHSDSKITKEIYIHVTKGIEKKEAEMMDKISLLPPFCPHFDEKIVATPIK